MKDDRQKRNDIPRIAAIVFIFSLVTIVSLVLLGVRDDLIPYAIWLGNIALLVLIVSIVNRGISYFYVKAKRRKAIEQQSELPRGAPLWVLIVVWGGLMALLVLLGAALIKRQQGTVQPGDAIPDFTLPLFSGYEYAGQPEVQISDFSGKVVVLNFWASWCKPCEQEAAEMQQAWEANKASGEVIFLGVDYVDTEPEARAYLKKFEIDYYNGPDKGTKISQLFRMKGVPETYFIDREGVLQYVKVGPFASANEIQIHIDKLLK